jgi:hypothetical protein
MRSTTAVSVFCCLLSGPAPAQLTSAPEPTQLEVWAGQSGSRITKSEEVGRIESADAQAVITAVVAERPHNAPSYVRGVRIDLRNASSTDQIYVDESKLVYLKHELDGMDCGVARMRNESGAIHRIHGIARCRPSQSVPQAYCPGYYIGPESEGLSVSTFSGGSFRFPSIRPSLLADAIGRAMSEFGLDDEIPTSDPIELPADDLDQIIASAIQHFPLLASSPGIKAAAYNSRDDKSSAWAIFWPYEHSGDMAYSRLVDCDAIGTVGEGWKCDRSRPRGYLTIPDQEREIVITDELDHEKAIALIEFAKLGLQDEPNYADMDDWKFSLIRVPEQALEAFLITGSDGDYGSILFEIKEAPQDVEERFEFVRISRSGRDTCSHN